MKLAEALILRADLQKRLEQVKMRLRNNLLIQEGDSPSEDPDYLLKEFLNMQAELTALIKRINRTNNSTLFEGKILLSDALVEREALMERRSILSSIANEASVRQDRYSKSEIKYISTINVKEVQKEADRVAMEYRKLDTKIQGLNWNVDLL